MRVTSINCRCFPLSRNSRAFKTETALLQPLGQRLRAFQNSSEENPLRPNPLKPRLAAGGCAFGTMTFEFFTPGYPAICREAGAEFIL